MAWQRTAPAVDEIAAPLKPGTSGTGLAMNTGNGPGILQHAPGCSLSPSGPVNVRLRSYVSGETMDIEPWGGSRVGRVSRRKAYGHGCVCALDSEWHRLLNKSVLGRTILLITFPSQLYFEENCIEQFWQYQESLNFPDFNVKKEKEGILHQVILHLTKIFE